ncbi:hypothetical protein JCM1841_002003, partial [Sporobolomyces salmonicolor]
YETPTFSQKWDEETPTEDAAEAIRAILAASFGKVFANSIAAKLVFYDSIKAAQKTSSSHFPPPSSDANITEPTLGQHLKDNHLPSEDLDQDESDDMELDEEDPLDEVVSTNGPSTAAKHHHNLPDKANIQHKHTQADLDEEEGAQPLQKRHRGTVSANSQMTDAAMGAAMFRGGNAFAAKRAQDEGKVDKGKGRSLTRGR